MIRAKPPPCRCWNFQLNNHWMESLDYRHHQVHTNNVLATPDPDGTGWYTIIVSHEDPNTKGFGGVWIETVGHTCGMMCFRWVAPQVGDDELPHPRIELVPFVEVLALIKGPRTASVSWPSVIVTWHRARRVVRKGDVRVELSWGVYLCAYLSGLPCLPHGMVHGKARGSRVKAREARRAEGRRNGYNGWSCAVAPCNNARSDKGRGSQSNHASKVQPLRAAFLNFRLVRRF